MAYVPNNLSLTAQNIAGGYRLWVYESTDGFTDVDATDYFSDAQAKGVQAGDFIIVTDTNASPVDVMVGRFSAIDADGNGTVLGLALTGEAGTFSSLTVTGNVAGGDAAADLVAFHGASGAGTSQRASSVQATSNIASSTDFGATQLAVVQEIMTTLTSKGIWKGSA